MPEPTSLDMSKNCLAVRLRRLNRAVSAIYDAAIRPLGVTISQLNILVVSDLQGDPTPSDIGRILRLEASTLSRNLERMRRRGWIEAISSTGDGRLAPFRLTASGRELLDQAHPLWKEAQQKAATLLGHDAAETIMSSPAAALSKR